MNKTDQTPEPIAPSSSGALTKRRLPRVVLGGAIVVFLVLTVAGLVAAKKSFDGRNRITTNDQSTETGTTGLQETEQTLTNPADGTKLSISKTDYYSVTVGSQTYYGTINKINDSYFRLTPTAYNNANKQLIFTGKELHGPEPVTYFRVDKISRLQKLDAGTEASVIEFLKSSTAGAQDAYPNPHINKYLKSDQLQAFFFADGRVLFAKAPTLEGNFLAALSRVYYLKAESGNGSGSGMQTSLAVAKPEQYEARTSEQLLYWQNMRPDSQISKSVTEFERR